MKPSTASAGRPLSNREFQALAWYAETPLYKTVANRMGITPDTVKVHLWSAHAKLNVPTSIDAFRVLGWLRPPRVRS